jgi:GrpE
MTRNSLRAAAVVAALVLAVLTGVVTGLVSRIPNCVNATVAPGTVCRAGDFALAPALISFGGAGAAGVAAFALMLLAGRRRPPRPRTAPAPRTSTASRTSSDGAGAALAADRAALVRACIYVRDRVSSKALADRLGEALHNAGVRTDEPAGARFDPAQHEAGSATPAEDPAQVGTIAAVEVPGYTDRGGRVLRVPVVTVYQAAATTDSKRAEEDR